MQGKYPQFEKGIIPEPICLTLKRSYLIAQLSGMD